MEKNDNNKDRFTSVNVIVLPKSKEKKDEEKKQENEELRKVFKGK